mgnify:CR=1 FL=1
MEKTNTEYINQIAYDMIYLASFGINSKGKPDEKCLERYRTNEENIKELFRMSAKHFIDALVGTTLKWAGGRKPGDRPHGKGCPQGYSL